MGLRRGLCPLEGGLGTSRSRSALGLRAPPPTSEERLSELCWDLSSGPRGSSAPMSGDALDASFVGDAENLVPDTFSNWLV